MNYWLVKFAPFRYSWQDVLRNGKFEIYSVRNAQARNNLKFFIWSTAQSLQSMK